MVDKQVKRKKTTRKVQALIEVNGNLACCYYFIGVKVHLSYHCRGHVFFLTSCNFLPFSPLEAAQVCAGTITEQNALPPLSLSLLLGWQHTYFGGTEI